MGFTIASTAFEEGVKIPEIHTCKGDDVSPHIWWDEEPKGTVSFALIVEDPDAPGGTFTHWIMYNIPHNTHELEKIIPIKKHLDNGAVQSKNDFGKIGYRGPCPPKGEEHRYYFKIFALKKKLTPETIDNREDLYKAIEGNVLDEAEYMGVF